MSDFKKPITIWDISPGVRINNDVFSVVEKISVQRAEMLDDLIFDEIVKCLPEDVTKTVFVDKNIVVDVFSKAMAKKPRKYMDFNDWERNGCPTCERNEILYAGQKYCSVCGQKILWEDR